jgi:hypothetical protein
MRNLVLSLLMTMCIEGYSQLPVTYPKPDEYPIYAQRGSLVGVARGWAPSRFYPIHPALRAYTNPLDTLVLYSGKRMDSLMRVYKIDRWHMTDTFYLPYKLKQAR